MNKGPSRAPPPPLAPPLPLTSRPAALVVSFSARAEATHVPLHAAQHRAAHGVATHALSQRRPAAGADPARSAPSSSRSASPAAPAASRPPPTSSACASRACRPSTRRRRERRVVHRSAHSFGSTSAGRTVGGPPSAPPLSPPSLSAIECWRLVPIESGWHSPQAARPEKWHGLFLNPSRYESFWESDTRSNSLRSAKSIRYRQSSRTRLGAMVEDGTSPTLPPSTHHSRLAGRCAGPCAALPVGGLGRRLRFQRVPTRNRHGSHRIGRLP